MRKIIGVAKADEQYARALCLLKTLAKRNTDKGIIRIVTLRPGVVDWYNSLSSLRARYIGGVAPGSPRSAPTGDCAVR